MLDRLHRSDRLQLIVTRRCNLRCPFCKEAFQEQAMSWETARRALEAFLAQRHSRLAIKLFGGEPTLEPELIRRIVEFVRDREGGRVRFETTTNGTHLEPDLIDLFAARPDFQVNLSLDGGPERHRGHRRVFQDVAEMDTYRQPLRYLDRLLRLPFLIVNHTVSPEAAETMAEDWRHLRSLGFTRFHWLPALHVVWTGAQVAALRKGFAEIALEMLDAWRAGVPLELANLFTPSRSAHFWEGVIVDADGSVFQSNVFLARPFDQLRERLKIGHVDDPGLAVREPPPPAQVEAWMREVAPPEIFDWTAQAGEALEHFLMDLLPERLAFEAKRRLRPFDSARASRSLGSG